MTATVLAACAALLLHAPRPAAAFCDCVGPRSDADAVRQNAVVFEGRPVRMRVVQQAPGLQAHVFTFAVTRVRKGTRARTVQVRTGVGGGDCGVSFEIGRSYTVYARRDANGRLVTYICSGPYLPTPAPPPARED
ncbi:MAG TPA: hypothetical protein VFJ82_06780 [Longimicrobium sp.]|nr:hypothetical protein [Longimicrobium sp.]